MNKYRVFFRRDFETIKECKHRDVKATSKEDAERLVRYMFAKVGEHIHIISTSCIFESPFSHSRHMPTPRMNGGPK